MTTLIEQTHLVGDVGGTYLRLGLVSAGDRNLSSTAKMRCSDFPDVAAALEAYLASFPQDRRPTRACLAVAGPVDGDHVRLTNNGFSFSTSELREALRFEDLLVVNDVAAAARGVQDLLPRQWVALTEDGLDLTKTVAVVAPGTGLGVAALVPSRHGPLVLPGEGGQVPVPVTAAASSAVVQELHRSGLQLRTEDLVSGGGLPRLDSALRRLRGSRGLLRSASEITSSGETLPGQVLDVFVELLAGAVQTYALTLGAKGGVVLGGGFLRDLTGVLQECRFVERFRDHPKIPDYLAAIPVVVDLRAHPALVGAACFLGDE